MKLKKIFGNIGRSIKVFPFSHILLIIATILGILNIYDIGGNFISNLILAVCFVFFLSLYEPLFSLHTKKSIKNQQTIGIIIPILLGIIYFFTIRNIDIFGYNLTTIEVYQYLGVILLSIIGIFLLVARISNKDEKKICFSWSNVFRSIFIGCVAFVVIGGGISGALASIEALFDVSIKSNIYEIVWLISGVLFASTLMLNNYQYNLSTIENIDDSGMFTSRTRKIFGLYIFTSLTAIYLAIFLVYGLKILFTGIRPKGIIVRLGIGYFCMGILSKFLIYPQNTKISKILSKSIDISFLYTVVMMLFAIAKRIMQYGITINRYFVCCFIILIIMYSLLALVQKNKNRLNLITIIFVLVLFGIYGPINVKRVSLKSQLHRFDNMVKTYDLSLPLSTGDLSNFSGQDEIDVYGVLSELMSEYKIRDRNKGIVDTNITDQFNYKYMTYYEIKSNILSTIGLKHEYSYNNDIIYNFCGNIFPIKISGYDKISEIESRMGVVKDNIWSGEIGGKEYNIDLNKYESIFLEKGSVGHYMDDCDSNRGGIEITDGNIKIVLRSAHGIMEDGKLKLEYFAGVILEK